MLTVTNRGEDWAKAVTVVCELEAKRGHDNAAVDGGSDQIIDPDHTAGYLTSSPEKRPVIARRKQLEAQGVLDDVAALNAPLTKSRELPERQLKNLARLGIYTPLDLITYLPRTLDDRRVLSPFRAAEPGPRMTFQGYVLRCVNVGRTPSRQILTLAEWEPVPGAPSPPALNAVWFNQQHLQPLFTQGRKVTVSSAVRQTPGHPPEVQSPEFDLDDERLNTQRVVPIYALTRGVKMEWLRKLIQGFLERYAHLVPDPRPDTTTSLGTILKTAHWPDTPETGHQARRDLAAAEILTLQTTLLQRRRHHAEQTPARPLRVAPATTISWLERLPFTPTAAQLRCIEEIRGDLVNPNAPPMQRLLQGEVGSGKTLVALAAAIDAATDGGQTALMAPTETLAHQHYNTLCELLDARHWNLGVPGVKQAKVSDGLTLYLGLLTGRSTAAERRGVLNHAKTGFTMLLVGTHALIEKYAQLPNLALAIVDEQHRFGVNQRGALRQDAHYLMLSATPIPRTTQLTLYRDLDLSVIDQLPPGRQPTRTRLLYADRREEFIDTVRERAARGEQTFIIYPYIDPSEEQPGLSLNREFPGWVERLPELKVAKAHGRMKPAERDQAVADFRNGRIDVLCATAIVEVGVDIPGATLMLIESAERFGLAQLHQFRGRIGRGALPGDCYLAITPELERDDRVAITSRERLSAMLATNDGMRLAQQDLRSRGSGEAWGTRQHGTDLILKIAPGFYDQQLLETQQLIADAVFAQDPELLLTKHQSLKAAVATMEQRMNLISTTATE